MFDEKFAEPKEMQYEEKNYGYEHFSEEKEIITGTNYVTFQDEEPPFGNFLEIKKTILNTKGNKKSHLVVGLNLFVQTNEENPFNTYLLMQYRKKNTKTDRRISSPGGKVEMNNYLYILHKYKENYNIDLENDYISKQTMRRALAELLEDALKMEIEEECGELCDILFGKKRLVFIPSPVLNGKFILYHFDIKVKEFIYWDRMGTKTDAETRDCCDLDFPNMVDAAYGHFYGKMSDFIQSSLVLKMNKMNLDTELELMVKELQNEEGDSSKSNLAEKFMDVFSPYYRKKFSHILE